MVYSGTSVTSFSPNNYHSNYGNYKGSTTYNPNNYYNGGNNYYNGGYQVNNGNMASTCAVEPGMWQRIQTIPQKNSYDGNEINYEGNGGNDGDKNGRGRKGRKNGGSGHRGEGGKKIKRGKTSMGRRTIQNSNSNRAVRELAGNLTNYNEYGTLEFEGIEDSIEDTEITERKMRRNAEANWSLRMNSIFPKNGELD